MARNVPAENISVFKRFPVLILLGYFPPIWAAGFLLGGVVALIGALAGFMISIVDTPSFYEVLTWPTVLYKDAKHEKAHRIIMKQQAKLREL